MTERRTPKAGLRAQEPELVEEPTEDLEPADGDFDEEEPLEDGEETEATEGEADDEEGPEFEEEEEAEEEDQERARRRERRAAAAAGAGAGFLGVRRLLGRGRLAREEETTGRVGTSIRAISPETRVRISDRVSAAYALIAAGALIGVLLFSLTFAPGGYFAPIPTQPPVHSFAPTFTIIPPSGSPPTLAPSSSGSPAASPSGSAAPTATPT